MAITSERDEKARILGELLHEQRRNPGFAASLQASEFQRNSVAHWLMSQEDENFDLALGVVERFASNPDEDVSVPVTVILYAGQVGQSAVAARSALIAGMTAGGFTQDQHYKILRGAMVQVPADRTTFADVAAAFTATT